MFTEGWVEFKDKKVAKNVASTLNGRNIGQFFFADRTSLPFFFVPSFNLDLLSSFHFPFSIFH